MTTVRRVSPPKANLTNNHRLMRYRRPDLQLDFVVNEESSAHHDRETKNKIKHVSPLHPQTGSKPHLGVPDISMTTGKPLSVLPWLPFGEVKPLRLP